MAGRGVTRGFEHCGRSWAQFQRSLGPLNVRGVAGGAKGSRPGRGSWRPSRRGRRHEPARRAEGPSLKPEHRLDAQTAPRRGFCSGGPEGSALLLEGGSLAAGLVPLGPTPGPHTGHSREPLPSIQRTRPRPACCPPAAPHPCSRPRRETLRLCPPGRNVTCRRAIRPWRRASCRGGQLCPLTPPRSRLPEPRSVVAEAELAGGRAQRTQGGLDGPPSAVRSGPRGPQHLGRCPHSAAAPSAGRQEAPGHVAAPSVSQAPCLPRGDGVSAARRTRAVEPQADFWLCPSRHLCSVSGPQSSNL